MVGIVNRKTLCVVYFVIPGARCDLHWSQSAQWMHEGHNDLCLPDISRAVICVPANKLFSCIAP
jgi:hypothetical protein